MIILDHLSELESDNIALTIGNFDGVHRGHKHIFETIRKKFLNAKILVITFVPHPVRVLKKPSQGFLLNSYRERRNLLGLAGVDFLFEISFDQKLALLCPEEFIKRFLCPVKNLKKIFIGHNFAFGVNKSGDGACLKSFFEQTPVMVDILDEFRPNDGKVSSTAVRNALLKGDIPSVAQTLGREYFMDANVVKSKGRGKRIGFPTININYDKDLIIPARGVYATSVELEGRMLESVTNVGINPTFNDGKEISIETHILDFDRDIYDENIRLFFHFRIRDEKKFSSATELAERIKEDIRKRCGP